MIRRGILALALMALPSAAFAQGTIEGTVRSNDSGAGLGGARVEVPALDIIAFTGPDGSFTLPDVAAGNHIIEVRLIATDFFPKTLRSPAARQPQSSWGSTS